MSDSVKVTPIDDGPLHISGEFILEDEEGTKFDVKGEVWLCRCGNSEYKPFCDGKHGMAGFESKCRVGKTENA